MALRLLTLRPAAKPVHAPTFSRATIAHRETLQIVSKLRSA